MKKPPETNAEELISDISAFYKNVGSRRNKFKIHIAFSLKSPFFTWKIEPHGHNTNEKLLAEANGIFRKIESYVKKIEDYDGYLGKYFLRYEDYLTFSDAESLSAYFFSSEDSLRKMTFALSSNNPLRKVLMETIEKQSNLAQKLPEYNEEFISKAISENSTTWSKSSFPLDAQQKRAVVTDNTFNLVIAGAGSGKTEVLTNRIAYLTNRKKNPISPTRILAITFQKKAAEEITERLKKQFGTKVKVRTFHALGYRILRNKKLKNKTEQHERNYVNSLFAKVQENPAIQEEVLKYITSHHDERAQTREETDFETKEKFYEYLRSLRYIALDGTPVKSKVEREIYNFFIRHTCNGKPVEIQYESVAPWMRTTGYLRDPKPDFFFPKFKIYLENWGLDRHGNVPAWFETTTAEYGRSMSLKKALFRKHPEYKLVETYAWEYTLPNFLDILQKRFAAALGGQVLFEPIPYPDLVEKVWIANKGNSESQYLYKNIGENITNFIRIAKTYDLSPNDIEKRLSSEPWSEKQRAFAYIALAVYEEYERDLHADGSIDYSDMINQSILKLDEKKELLENTFDHILIDEYQDMSQQRSLLVKAILKKNPNCHLFCVGDDWQSIHGFAGSDLDYFINFGKHFSRFTRTDLTINYRSNKSIVETSQHIISHNGEAQIKKIVVAQNDAVKQVRAIAITQTNKFGYLDQMVRLCINQIERLLKEGYKPRDILILMRITKNKYLTNSLVEYSRRKGIRLNGIPIHFTRSEGGISVMSVHKSKGLQAKAVFILNMIDDLYGFPSSIENPDIYEPASLGRPLSKLEEERRLFYVAVTRAKEQVYIYYQKSRESQFLKELHGLTEIIEAQPNLDEI